MRYDTGKILEPLEDKTLVSWFFDVTSEKILELIKFYLVEVLCSNENNCSEVKLVGDGIEITAVLNCGYSIPSYTYYITGDKVKSKTIEECVRNGADAKARVLNILDEMAGTVKTHELFVLNCDYLLLVCVPHRYYKINRRLRKKISEAIKRRALKRKRNTLIAINKRTEGSYYD